MKGNIITLTPAAVERVKSLIANSTEHGTMLRVGIEKGGVLAFIIPWNMFLKHLPAMKL